MQLSVTNLLIDAYVTSIVLAIILTIILAIILAIIITTKLVVIILPILVVIIDVSPNFPNFLPPHLRLQQIFSVHIV